ncbi:cAMP-binding protein [Desulfocapsa sulfexigens DSM 10523]|uniref:cAMP-binding protein n=1 Tax=Desulfocapsa sulfexigens (strain DSM 10523 / SB164P1) TaxID=1167006 RepID=M1PDE7_DESSD|nr:Crp/Fnr family transcriptional regulator [Desulfocapsa sulfexigens]AGF77765.1 cAMP-binding protein [Desulfocapsa sulfexigens DSM 10523]
MKKANFVLPEKMTPEQKFFRTIPQLSLLEDNQVFKLAQKTIKKKYRKGEYVFFQGDPVDHLYFLEIGKVEVYKSDINGKKLSLWYIEESEIFCLAALYSPKAFACAEVMEDALIYSLLKKDFDEVMTSSHALSRNLIRCVCNKLVAYSTLVDDIAFKKIEVRLAKALLGNQSSVGNDTYVCQLSQDELAAQVGTRREVVARCLKAFRERDLIKISNTGRPRNIIIHSCDALQDIVDQE